MWDNTSVTNKGLVILVVEDSRLFREMLCEVISVLQPDARIYEAKNGQEGLELAHTVGPDLIFLDLHMPVMNGYQLALALRQTPETAQIPLILITSEHPQFPQILRLRAFCQAALFKPFALSDLEHLLDQACMADKSVLNTLQPEKEMNVLETVSSVRV